MRARFRLATGLALLISSFAFGHGEDRPGPHGGLIQMPGGFHTELLRVSGTQFKVYLLDENWKDPVVENSGVTASVQRKGERTVLSCKPDKDFFRCDLPKGRGVKNGETLIIDGNRKGMPGVSASYRVRDFIRE